MSEESMAWLGAALWLKELGYSTQDAAACAQPLLDALAAAGKGGQS